MKRLLFLSLFLFGAQGLKAATVSDQPQERFLSTLIFLDDGYNERPNEFNAFGGDLALAIGEQSTPIIVTGHILNSYLSAYKRAQKASLRSDYRKFIKEYLEKLDKTHAITSSKEAIDQKLKEMEFGEERTAVFSQFFQEDEKEVKAINELTSSLTKETRFWLESYLLLSYEFVLDQWNMYKHPQANLFLLIPKNYQKKQEDAFGSYDSLSSHLKTKYTKSELATGFAFKEQRFIPIHNLIDLKIDLKPCNSMACQIKSSLVYAGAYYFLTGKYPLKRASSEQLMQCFVSDPQGQIGKWNILLGGHGFFASKNYKNHYQRDIVKLSRVLGLERDTIAGLSVPQFYSLLTLLNKDIKTNTFYYQTCYGGDYHLDMIIRYAALRDDKIQQMEDIEKQPEGFNYGIISGALTDQETEGSFALYYDLKLSVNYEKYFASVSVPIEKLTIDDLKKGCQEIAPRLRPVSDVPLILYPGQKEFKVIDITDNLGIITKQDLLKSDLKFKYEKALLIYPSVISVPIEIEGSYSFPFISMQPSERVVLFNSIKASTWVPFFMAIAGDNEVAYERTFYIDSLKVKNASGSIIDGYLALKDFPVDSEGYWQLENVIVYKTPILALPEITGNVIGTKMKAFFVIKDADRKKHYFKFKHKSEKSPTWKEITQQQFEVEADKINTKKASQRELDYVGGQEPEESGPLVD